MEQKDNNNKKITAALLLLLLVGAAGWFLWQSGEEKHQPLEGVSQNSATTAEQTTTSEAKTEENKESKKEHGGDATSQKVVKQSNLFSDDRFYQNLSEIEPEDSIPVFSEPERELLSVDLANFAPKNEFSNQSCADLLASEPLPEVEVWQSELPYSSFSTIKPRLNRIDRGINTTPFIFKGEYALGISASYISLNSVNSEFMVIAENITAHGGAVGVKPFVGYAYADNKMAGVKFAYTRYEGVIDTANVNLGPSNDINLAMPYVNFFSDNYAYSLFHRSYASLDKKGRFGVFADLELSYNRGYTRFAYDYEGTSGSSLTKSSSYKIAFNPGVAVYIFPNVCTTVSFGLGGLGYSSAKQYDNLGNVIGERKFSDLSLKFNLLAVNLGIVVHLW